jgi:hypothetical protein
MAKLVWATPKELLSDMRQTMKYLYRITVKAMRDIAPEPGSEALQ